MHLLQLTFCCLAFIPSSLPSIKVVTTPDGGIQPQAVADQQGHVHLIYFKGDPHAGDVFYVRMGADGDGSSKPIRVNSQPGSAIAVGSIRGGQIALGRQGRVHVAWNGSQKALPQNPAGGSPMLYARLNDQGTAFEPQRNLIHDTVGLDGGGAVAADSDGNVYVAWHALKAGNRPGEENRQVWLAHSSDDGKTFAPEIQANDRPTGACGCCGMRAFAQDRGKLVLLYRAATKGTQRDMILLGSEDAGKRFKSTVVDKWQLEACPMSSEAFAAAPSGLSAAWETKGKVSFGSIDRMLDVKKKSPSGQSADAKHPAMAINQKGETLLAWTEGTGWQRGGDLAWQLFDGNGRAIGDAKRLKGGVPVWGLVSVVADKDGGFTIFH